MESSSPPQVGQKGDSDADIGTLPVCFSKGKRRTCRETELERGLGQILSGPPFIDGRREAYPREGAVPAHRSSGSVRSRAERDPAEGPRGGRGPVWRVEGVGSGEARPPPSCVMHLLVSFAGQWGRSRRAGIGGAWSEGPPPFPPPPPPSPTPTPAARCHRVRLRRRTFLPGRQWRGLEAGI